VYNRAASALRLRRHLRSTNGTDGHWCPAGGRYPNWGREKRMSCISCRTPMDIDGARIKSSQSSSPSSSDERLGLISGEIYRTTCRNKPRPAVYFRLSVRPSVCPSAPDLRPMLPRTSQSAHAGQPSVRDARAGPYIIAGARKCSTKRCDNYCPVDATLLCACFLPCRWFFIYSGMFT